MACCPDQGKSAGCHAVIPPKRRGRFHLGASSPWSLIFQQRLQRWDQGRVVADLCKPPTVRVWWLGVDERRPALLCPLERHQVTGEGAELRGWSCLDMHGQRSARKKPARRDWRATTTRPRPQSRSETQLTHRPLWSIGVPLSQCGWSAMFCRIDRVASQSVRARCWLVRGWRLSGRPAASARARMTHPGGHDLCPFLSSDLGSRADGSGGGGGRRTGLLVAEQAPAAGPAHSCRSVTAPRRPLPTGLRVSSNGSYMPRHSARCDRSGPGSAGAGVG